MCEESPPPPTTEISQENQVNKQTNKRTKSYLKTWWNNLLPGGYFFIKLTKSHVHVYVLCMFLLNEIALIIQDTHEKWENPCYFKVL